MYQLFPTKVFLRKAKSVIDTQVKKSALEKTLQNLELDPFYPALRTHKVQSRKFGQMYSSKVTPDLRLIWNFDQDNSLILLLLDIGGHSGGNKVYN
jgi:mRNA-degrading endonuclease YafQ of YafQ-DinJ toxin-antitoxin module